MTLGQAASSAKAAPTRPAAKGLLLSPDPHLASSSLHHPLTRPFQHPCWGRGGDVTDHLDIMMIERPTGWCNRNVFNLGTPEWSAQNICVPGCTRSSLYM